MKTRILLTAALFGMMMQTSIFAESNKEVNYINDVPFETENVSDYHNRLIHSVNTNQAGSELTESIPFEMPLVFHFDDSQQNAGLNLPDSTTVISTAKAKYIDAIPFETEKVSDYHSRLMNAVKVASARQELNDNIPYLTTGTEIIEKITIQSGNSSSSDLNNTTDSYVQDVPFNVEKPAEYNNRLENFINKNQHSEEDLIEPVTYVTNIKYNFNKTDDDVNVASQMPEKVNADFSPCNNPTVFVKSWVSTF